MNATNTLYRVLCNDHQSLLEMLEQAVTCCSPADAEQYLSPLLALHQMLPEEPLDYIRLYAFFTKNFQGCDLQKEDLSLMNLRNFNFTGADLSYANLTGADLSHANLFQVKLIGSRCRLVQMQQTILREAILCDAKFPRADLSYATLDDADLTGADFTSAILSNTTCLRVLAKRTVLECAQLASSVWNDAVLDGACLIEIQATQASFVGARLRHVTASYAVLTEANLVRAQCSYGNWHGTTLQAASLREADFSYSNLQRINVEDATLSGCDFSGTIFGETLQYNSNTNIDVSNHDLIAMILLSCAHTPSQEQFALYIRYKRGFCWSDFTKLLLHQSTDMAAWVKEALGEVDSLRYSVERYEKYFQELLADVKWSLDLHDINPSLHALIAAETEKHPDLKDVERYWFVFGVLVSASKQSDIAVSEEQYAVILDRLQRFKPALQ